MAVAVTDTVEATGAEEATGMAAETDTVEVEGPEAAGELSATSPLKLSLDC